MKKRYLMELALVLAMAAPVNLVAKDYGKLGNLWLPDGVVAEMRGPTLVASAGDSTGLTVHVYQAEVTHEEREGFLKDRAVELGIPTFVRTLSDQQRQFAGIDWGGYVLGTALRVPENKAEEQIREAAEEAPKEVKEVDFQTLNPLAVDSLDETDSTQSDSGEDGLPENLKMVQPEGNPSVQHMVLLYVKGKQGVVLEMRVNLPEGDSMVLTDIQRQWKLGK